MSPTTRTRRIAVRVAVAGALAAVPVTALAIPASADPISDATTLVNDWSHDGQWFPGQQGPSQPGPGQNRDWRHDRRGNDAPPPPLPLPLPLPPAPAPAPAPAPNYNYLQSLPTGSFG